MAWATRRKGGAKGVPTHNVRMKGNRGPKGTLTRLTMNQRRVLEKRKELASALRQEKNKCVVLYSKVLKQLEKLLEYGEADAYSVVREIYDKIYLYKPILGHVVPELFPESLELEDTMDYLEKVTKFVRKSVPVQKLSATIANAVIKTMPRKRSASRPMNVNRGASRTPPSAPPSAEMAELEALLGDLTM